MKESIIVFMEPSLHFRGLGAGCSHCNIKVFAMTIDAGAAAAITVTVTEELTPEHLRCGSGFCPAVYKASDGDLVIIGKIPSQQILDQMAKKIGHDEFIVKISPEFFGNTRLDD